LQDGVRALTRTMHHGCAALGDAMLPDCSGLQLQRRLADRIDIPIVFIAGSGDVCTTVQAMKAGAFECLTKPLDHEVLLEAVGGALERSRVVMIRNAELRALRECYASLTPRQRDVMTLVVSGLLNKQIGGELGISEVTVTAPTLDSTVDGRTVLQCRHGRTVR
jgi:FixJ family two-component response regulator